MGITKLERVCKGDRWVKAMLLELSLRKFATE